MPGVDYIKVFQGEDGDWYFGAYSANHEEVAQSEGYTRKSDAEQAARSAFPDKPLEVEDDAGS